MTDGGAKAERTQARVEILLRTLSGFLHGKRLERIDVRMLYATRR